MCGGRAAPPPAARAAARVPPPRADAGGSEVANPQPGRTSRCRQSGPDAEPRARQANMESAMACRTVMPVAGVVCATVAGSVVCAAVAGRAVTRLAASDAQKLYYVLLENQPPPAGGQMFCSVDVG